MAPPSVAWPPRPREGEPEEAELSRRPATGGRLGGEETEPPVVRGGEEEAEPPVARGGEEGSAGEARRGGL